MIKIKGTKEQIRNMPRHFININLGVISYFDIYFSGISSFTFSKNGQGFYLQSASEYARVTLSARYVTEPTCSLELKEGMRVVVEDEPEPETQEAAQTEDNTEYVVTVHSESANVTNLFIHPQ